jgi:hypothetical protein
MIRNSLRRNSMNKKRISLIILLFLALFIGGLSVIEVTHGGVGQLVFDQMSYNYTSGVAIPPKTPNEMGLGGYYTIDGKGRNFNFLIRLPGAENSESPLDYTSDGLTGTGKLDHIQITLETIKSFLYGDMKGAVLDTKLSGVYNMSCAAWTGDGNFYNNGNGFMGTFKIYGQQTYYQGNFTIELRDKRIALISDFIRHPNRDPNNITKVQNNIVYM